MLMVLIKKDVEALNVFQDQKNINDAKSKW